IRIVGIDLRAAVQIIQQYIDRPIIFSGSGPGPQVTLETPHPVARADVPRLLRGLLDAQGYELVSDTASGTYRARQKPGILTATNSGPPLRVAGAPELFVIPLRHARAADVAQTINALFGHAVLGVAPLSAPLEATPAQPPASRPATITGELTIV